MSTLYLNVLTTLHCTALHTTLIVLNCTVLHYTAVHYSMSTHIHSSQLYLPVSDTRINRAVKHSHTLSLLSIYLIGIFTHDIYSPGAAGAVLLTSLLISNIFQVELLPIFF